MVNVYQVYKNKNKEVIFVFVIENVTITIEDLSGIRFLIKKVFKMSFYVQITHTKKHRAVETSLMELV